MASNFAPTYEQQDAVDAYLTGQNIVIEAGAGSGKTSTLQLIARAQPGRRGLYVAFNKAIANEAARKFAGTGVQSKTVHSLAFRDFGAPRRHRLDQKYMFWHDKAKLLSINSKYDLGTGSETTKFISRQSLVRVVTETVDAFCKVADQEITPALVPLPDGLLLRPDTERDFRWYITQAAKRYWADILDMDGNLPFKHDYYLKLYQLSQPRLEADYILFDEVQDADALMVDIVSRQTETQVAAVGDPNQAIYSWRGATNALEKFGGIRTQLTQSFRFGDAIAAEANYWLDLLDARIRLKGLDGAPSSVWASKRQPEAILTRSNAGAIREILESQERGTKVGIGGESKTKELRALAVAAKELQEKGSTNHRDLDIFNSWDDVVLFSQLDDGSDIAALVKVIDEYGSDKVVKAIDACVPLDQAQQTVSTIHVSKGLEWFHVRIADDFREPRKDSEGNPTPMPREEARLAYVAVTRAQRHLDASGLDWIKTFQGGIAPESVPALAEPVPV